MATKKKAKITASMSFTEIMDKYPQVIEILLEKGMHCIGCPMSMQENLGQGAKAHGLDPKELIKEINERLEEK